MATTTRAPRIAPSRGAASSLLVKAQDSQLKPPLKWAGGKRWLAAELETIWTRFSDRRYVEPFCGGLAIPLALRPRKALLNDVNPHLANFYRQVQLGLKISIKVGNDPQLFYSHRERFNQLIRENSENTTEAAQLFYYLNRTCFNGLCRFNRRGEFNVPFGSYRTINYANDFDEYRSLFEQWEFSNDDLESMKINSQDFIYADPPYDVEFTTYSAGGFDWQDQLRTAKWLAQHPGPVVLSNQATTRIIELYQRLGFNLRYLEAPRRISCTGDRTKAFEVLATRNI